MVTIHVPQIKSLLHHLNALEASFGLKQIALLAEGIEPSIPASKAGVQPLDYTIAV